MATIDTPPYIGTDDADTITTHYIPKGDGDKTVDALGGDDTVVIDHPHTRYIVNLGDGNDTLNVIDPHYQGGSVEVHGGEGNDVINGSQASDVIYGDGGDDQIFTGEVQRLGGDRNGFAANTVYGGDGNDVIRGVGNFYGGDGNDTLTSIDYLKTGHTLDGGIGNDRLDAGQGGGTILIGGEGADIFVAHRGIAQDFNPAEGDKIDVGFHVTGLDNMRSSTPGHIELRTSPKGNFTIYYTDENGASHVLKGLPEGIDYHNATADWFV